MKIDWDKVTGKWNIRDVQTDVLIAQVDTVRLFVPAEFVSVNGGRHGYCVAAGHVAVSENVATIKGR